MSASRPIFEIYVDDDRYAVPTLHLVFAEDETAALRIAQQLLAETAHHLGIELCQGGQLLVSFGSFAERPRAESCLLTRTPAAESRPAEATSAA